MRAWQYYLFGLFIMLTQTSCVSDGTENISRTSTGEIVIETYDIGPVPEKAAALAIPCAAGDASACNKAGDICKDNNQFHRAVEFYKAACSVVGAWPSGALAERYAENDEKIEELGAERARYDYGSDKFKKIDERRRIYMRNRNAIYASINGCSNAASVYVQVWKDDDGAYPFAVLECKFAREISPDSSGRCFYKDLIDDSRRSYAELRTQEAQSEAQLNSQMMQVLTQGAMNIATIAAGGTPNYDFSGKQAAASGGGLVSALNSGAINTQAAASDSAASCNACLSSGTYAMYKAQCGKTMAACYCGAAYVKKCCGDASWTQDARVAQELGTNCSLP